MCVDHSKEAYAALLQKIRKDLLEQWREDTLERELRDFAHDAIEQLYAIEKIIEDWAGYDAAE